VAEAEIPIPDKVIYPSPPTTVQSNVETLLRPLAVSGPNQISN